MTTEPSVETAEGRQAFRDICRERLHPQLGQALDALDAREAKIAALEAQLAEALVWNAELKREAYDHNGRRLERALVAERKLLVAERKLAEARAEERKRSAALAVKLYPKGGAHTYGSENADIYRAQEIAAESIAAAISALRDSDETARGEG